MIDKNIQHPIITNMEQTGYSDGKESVLPRCPICDAECEFIYRYKNMEIAGCDICLHAIDAWDIAECF